MLPLSDLKYVTCSGGDDGSLMLFIYPGDCCSGETVQHTLIAAPQEPGKWSLWALTLSPSVGLRFSPPQTVTVFRPLQVDFKLPTSLRVGEAVEVDVKIGNNINSCMDVS